MRVAERQSERAECAAVPRYARARWRYACWRLPSFDAARDAAFALAPA